jgi:hypothetical protein
MQHTVTWPDRLRIERLIWFLDQQLYDLPRKRRIDTRREVRANLLAAAQEVGAKEALRRVGASRQLAESYLSAELGSGPRHSWIAATYFAALVPLALNFFLSEATNAYAQAVTAADPHATGTHTWHGVTWLQNAVTFTFDHGVASHSGGSWTVLVYVLWIAGTIACGRLWRLLPLHRGSTPATPGAE